MKTSELIAALAGAEPVRPVAPARGLALPVLVGVALTVTVLAITLGFQPMSSAVGASWFWMKAGYSLALALAGMLLLVPLARPGARLGAAGFIIAAISLASIAMMAAHASMHATAAARPALWLGDTWRMCSMRILALAVPIFLSVSLGLRRMAPTRLRLAGAAAGLLAGGLSAAVYGLYCQESTAPFVVAWYSLGVAVCALVGAAVGPRLLRW